MKRAFRIARAILVLAALLALVALLRHTDARRLWALIASRGPVMVLALVPFLVAMAVDTAGWRLVLRQIGHRLRYLPLLRIRLVSEGAMLSLPGGSLAAEALKPVLLKQLHEVPVSAGTASVVIKKSLVVLSNSVYLGLGLLVGSGIIRAAAPTAAPALITAALVGAITCFLLGAGAILTLALRAGPWWRRKPARLAGTAELASSFFRRRSSTRVTCFTLFLVVWLIEAMETFAIARLLGLPLTPAGALAFESLIALGRAVGFVLPAGLGIQDLGHVMLARVVGPAAGADAATMGAALILTKRSKEVFWIVTGALLLSGTSKQETGHERAA
jgi:hypothetical protein